MVETLSKLFKERLNFNDEEHVKLVQRSLLLYRQNLVLKVKQVGLNEVTATVQDVTPVKVQLDAAELENSSCECPQQGVCRHQLAVFFAMLAKFQSVTKWIDDWKRGDVLASLPIQRGMKKSPATVSIEEKIPGWMSRFEDEWNQIDSLTVSAINQMYHKFSWQEPENRQLKLIYRLTLQIFFLQKLFSLSPRELENVRIQIDYYIDQAKQTMQAFQTQTLSFDTDTYFQQLGKEMHPIMKEGHGLLLEKFSLYTEFWTFLCKSPTLRQEERKWWKQVIEEEHPSFSNQPSIYIAYWHIQILTGYEEEVMKTLDDLMEPSYVYILLHWLQYFISEKQWTRSNTFFDKFLKWWPMYSEVVDHDQATFTAEKAVHLAKVYSNHRKLPVHEKLLETLLPYSFHDYASYMVRSKQFRKWAELLHSISYQVRDIPYDLLSSVEATDPKALLPLYHRSVISLVQEKKRQSYKDAVRLLLKLKEIYENMGEYEAWNSFMIGLMDETSRLRAFHEECKRGKLLNGPVEIY
ncbi:SWIM zinc finger family protein [Bacillus carboniphilus]